MINRSKDQRIRKKLNIEILLFPNFGFAGGLKCCQICCSVPVHSRESNYWQNLVNCGLMRIELDATVDGQIDAFPAFLNLPPPPTVGQDADELIFENA